MLGQTTHKLGTGSAIIKATNLEKQLKHTNKLLENLFKANYKEFERYWYPLNFEITAVASTSALTLVGAVKKFPFSYFIKSIAILNETNVLAGIALEFDDKLYPREGFSLAGTTLTETKNTVFRGNNYMSSIYDFNLFLNKAFELKVYYINTHTSNQQIYLSILGYRIPQNQALITIKKEGVVRYER